MFINSEKLSVEIKKLLELIEKYNDIYINYYNTLNESSSYWNSSLSIKFFSDVSVEKNKVEMAINDLKNIADIYTYMVESYGAIGKKIKYDLSKEEILTQLFNKYIEKIDSTIILYRTLEIDAQNMQIIENQKEILNNNKKKIIEIRKYYIDLFNKIREIDIEVKNRIKNLKIDYIKESEIQQYL